MHFKSFWTSWLQTQPSCADNNVAHGGSWNILAARLFSKGAFKDPLTYQENKENGFLEIIQYFMRNAGLDEAQAGIKIAGRNINLGLAHDYLLLLLQ